MNPLEIIPLPHANWGVVWGMLIVYFAVMIGIGFYYSRPRYLKDTKDLILTGYRVGRWRIAGSIGATWINGVSFAAFASLGYLVGMSGY